MEIKTTSPVSIVKGYGELFFPEVFRTDCYLSSLNCVSLSLKSKRPAASDSLILTCNGSHYVDADNTRKPNVLALFEEKKGVVQFNDLHLPLTSPRKSWKYTSPMPPANVKTWSPPACWK